MPGGSTSTTSKTKAKAKEMRLDKVIELVAIILVVVFLTCISIWHAFGDERSVNWRYFYHLANHLFMLSLCLMVWIYTDHSILRAIMPYMVASYILFKIAYNTLIYLGVNIGGDGIWEIVWSHVCIIIPLVGAIAIWRLLKRIG